MSNPAALLDQSFIDPADLPDRDEVLARYQRLREIGKRHHHEVMKFLTKDAIGHQARRLGMTEGKTIVVESMDELTLAVDLAIHTAPPDRTRAIDRYARSGQFARGSEDAAMLQAMRNGRFAILKVKQRHPTVGLIATDLFRDIDIWLVDVGLESSLQDGVALASRYFMPDAFAITAGIAIPIGRGELERAIAMLPHLMRKSKAEAIQDRRFAEAVYRELVESGVMKRVRFRDPLGDASEAQARDN